MVLIHDDANGIDIRAHGGLERQKALFQLIDAQQAQRLLRPVPAVDFFVRCPPRANRRPTVTRSARSGCCVKHRPGVAPA